MTLEQKTDISALPEWDLSDLFPTPYHPNISAALTQLEAKCTEFNVCYYSQVNNLDSESLLKSLKEFEKIHDDLFRISSFAYLYHTTDTKSAERKALLQEVEERMISVNNKLIFYTIEIIKIPNQKLEVLLSSNLELKNYTTWFKNVRLWQDHILSESEEQILQEKSLTSSTALVSLYDQHLTKLKFTINNESKNLSEALKEFDSPESEKRKAAALEIGTVLNDNTDVFTFITNTLVKDKEIEDKLRSFPNSRSSRDLSNKIDGNVVDALVSTVVKNYSNISHRYYKLKARLLGKEKLEYWDIHAPIFLNTQPEYISWDKAKQIVLSSLNEFSPEFKKIAQTFFDKNWIDAKLAPFKRDGAFAHPTTPSAHPYIMVNYQNNSRSVTTLAHELGHGIHQMLSNRQGALMYLTPLTLAETASVFSEQLVFQNLLKNEQDKQTKIQLIAKKIESMIGTVIRQISFHEFEKEIHSLRKKGELTSNQLSDIWYLKLKESLGDFVNIDPLCSHYWMYISHFIHSPFYVYAYAFGDCLVNSLYSVYKSGTVEHFEKKYTEMLSLGGKFGYRDLLPVFGLDASSEDFWQHGLNTISDLIDELEKLCN